MEPTPDDPGQDTGPDAERPLTAVEAAKAAGVHERTIRRAIAGGSLKATKRRNAFRIAPADLRAWQREQEADTGPDPVPESLPVASAPAELVDELRRLLDDERTERQEAQRKVAELTGQIGYFQGQAEAMKSQLAAITAGGEPEDRAIAADFIHRRGESRPEPTLADSTAGAEPSHVSAWLRRLFGRV